MIDIKDLVIDCPVKVQRVGMCVGVTSPAVRITHVPTGTVAEVHARSQHQSRNIAMEMIEWALTNERHLEKQTSQ